MYPSHEIIEKDGKRTYVRLEQGGNRRVLTVWSLENCRQRVKERQAEGRLREFFDNMAAQLAFHSKEPCDPMLAAWFQECWENCERAYNEVVAPADTIEEFGTTDIEEFGIYA